MSTTFDERKHNILQILKSTATQSHDKTIQTFLDNITLCKIKDTVRANEDSYNSKGGTYDILSASILRGKNIADIQIIKNLIETYIKKYPSTLLYRTKLFDSLSFLYATICDYMKTDCDCLENSLTKSPDLEIIHILHEKKEVSKQYLVAALHTTTDTIERHIESINLTYGEIIQSHMQGRNLVYTMPNTIHPLRFSFTMEEVGDLIRSLALSYRYIPSPDEHSNNISENRIKELCAEVWLQLSDYAKSRTKDIYFEFDENLESFIEDVEDFIENPKEVSKEKDFDDLLQKAFKREAVCNIRTKTETFHNYYVFPNTFGTSTSASNVYFIEPKEFHMHNANGFRSNKPNSNQKRLITIDDIMDIIITN